VQQMVRTLGLAVTVNLCAKFEKSMFTHYEDREGDKYVDIGVVCGLWVTQGHRSSIR